VVALRRSTLDDAHDVAPLILEAAPYLRLLLGDAHEAWHAAEACYRTDRTMFGARFGMVAEENGDVAGVVIAFRGRLWASLKLGTGVLLARSAGVPHAAELVKRARVLDRLHPTVPRDALYVSALATQERHRRRGVARALMERVIAGAGALALGVALDVDLEHEAARKLYRSLGFEEVEARPIKGSERELLRTEGLIRMARRPEEG
jgi:ribosomal protein S18 acetylase RimI-like enzyme